MVAVACGMQFFFTPPQVIRNVELENALLKAELTLYQREENIKELEMRNDRLVELIDGQKVGCLLTFNHTHFHQGAGDEKWVVE
jgi:hypothetical protein